PSASDASKAVQITQSMIADSPLSVSSGTSTGSAASATATSSTSTYAAGSGPGIVNLLAITGEDQVALKVRIAEVQRSVTKQLGINVGGSVTGDKFHLSSPGGLSPLVDTGGGKIGVTLSGTDWSINAVLQALDETSMIRTLAEPTLTAVSGETA